MDCPNKSNYLRDKYQIPMQSGYSAVIATTPPTRTYLGNFLSEKCGRN